MWSAHVDFSKVEMEARSGCRVQLAHTGVNDEKKYYFVKNYFEKKRR